MKTPEEAKVDALYSQLEHLNFVTILLQTEMTSICDANFFLSGVSESFPELECRLNRNAKLVERSIFIILSKYRTVRKVL